MPGPLGTPNNSPQVDSGTMARKRSKPPGVIGLSRAQIQSGQSKSVSKAFTIQLDLKELIEIDQPLQGAVSQTGSLSKVTVLAKGSVVNKDPNRPKKVLAIVQKIFALFAGLIKIELDTPAPSDRLLRTQFGWPLIDKAGRPQVSKKYGQFYDPAFVGAGARGLSRSRLGKFKPVKGDAKKGVTAYVFEGAIGVVIMEFFGGKANVDNIFATAIAHELGHNLGLKHEVSPNDIMFVYAGKSEREQKHWMTAAEKNALKFTSAQIVSIRHFLRTS